jgi:hypothetical protein
LTRFAENSGKGFGVSAYAESKLIIPKIRKSHKKFRIITARLTGF